MPSFQENVRTLATAQKTKKGVSLYSRWVNRPIGRLFAATAASLGIGPNSVTAISAFVTAAGLVLLVVLPATAGTGIAVAVILVLGFALDSADGQVARLTGRTSPAGEWLDHVVDAGKMVAVHAAVLIAAWRWNLVPQLWMALPLAYLFLSVVFFSALTLFDLISRTRPAPAAVAPPSPPSPIRAIGLVPADYGVLAMSFALWGAVPVFFGVYLLLFVCTTLIASALMVKWFRALSVPTAA